MSNQILVVSRSDKTFGPKEFGQMVSVPSYHTTCYKNYTAFRKRPLSGASENPAPLKIRNTRSTLDIAPLTPSTIGTMKGVCLFCGKPRKNKNADESLSVIMTMESWDTIVSASLVVNDERVRSLVQSVTDPVAKDVQYHNSCKLKFMITLKIKRNTDMCPY